MSSMNTQAIDAALRSDWESAIRINKEILEEHPDHIDALNRLAYAYSKTGKLDDSIATYKEILKNDSYNPIAKKNLDKVTHLKSKSSQTTSTKQ